MDKETRNDIREATEAARKLLTEDFAEQLLADFNVHSDGRIDAKPRSPELTGQHAKIIAAIQHKRAAGFSAADAVADYLRDAAFTTLNRFVALKMLEARELVQQCVTKGEESSGYGEFCGLMPGLRLLPNRTGYRLYIESLFDELSTEVKVLFDRRDPAAVLWPSRPAFDQLLMLLNDAKLAGVWGEDETIGWVYQYFNSQIERDEVKQAKRVPEIGREISIRSQFFTPKHVVAFLVDNTLGAIWSASRAPRAEVARSFSLPAQTDNPPLTKRDPRDLRVLDPACGSAHFLLYAFERFVDFYEEAWADQEAPPSTITGRTLLDDYPSETDLRRAVPGLILRHNLFGVDIDSRCAQIASLALWMRAQKCFRDFGISRAERPRITRSNIVIASPVIAGQSFADDFSKALTSDVATIFRAVIDEMKHAGDLGILLRVEKRIAECIREVVANRGPLFKLDNDEAWARAEGALNAALLEIGSGALGNTVTQRNLFSDDVAAGLDFVDICRGQYDAVLLNPPYSEVGGAIASSLRAQYPENWTNLYSAFIERALELSSARVGVVCSDSILTGYRMRNLRQEFVQGQKLIALAPLNRETFDGMGLATVAIVLSRNRLKQPPVLGVLTESSFTVTDTISEAAISEKVDFVLTPDLIRHGHKSWDNASQLGDKYAVITSGNRTFDDFRYVRLWWEVAPNTIGEYWHPWQKGGEYQPFFSSTPFVMRWDTRTDGYEIRAFGFQRVNTDAQVAQSSRYWWKPGLVGPTMNTTGAGFNARLLPAGQIISAKSTGIFPKEKEDTFFLLGLLNSRAIRWMLFQQGAGLSGNTGKIQNLPVAEPSEEQKKSIGDLAQRAAGLVAELESVRETSPYFVSPICDLAGTVTAYRSVIEDLDRQAAILCQSGEIDARVPAGADLVDKAVEQATGGLSLGEGWQVVEYLVGLAFGRWQRADIKRVQQPIDASLTAMPIPNSVRCVEDAPSIIVDDEGQASDFCDALVKVGRKIPDFDVEAHLEFVGGQTKGGIRGWLRLYFFELHRSHYSEGRRKAPIYWQLATPSASYSVWLYVHAFNRDSMFRVQEDYVDTKLRHEERKLQSLRKEHGPDAGPADRRVIAEQEVFVDELRGFLEEIRRVTPLWNPNLDDGVLLNFAPLWRLVPQNRAWQKELKAAWDGLCSEEYDWAHLAMHLWPERVVPKCATDRSLAIAHGLESVFWVQGSDGKWTSRATPTRPIAELVQERSSPAVKAALTNLLEAPVAAVGRGKRGRAAKTITVDML